MTSYNKAWLASVIAGLSTFIATVQGRTDLDSASTIDWIIIVLAAVVAGMVVYATPNRP